MIDFAIVDELRSAGVADDLVRRVEELTALAVLQRRELEGRSRLYEDTTAAAARMRRERAKPQQERAKRIILDTYPDGVPSDVGDTELVNVVQASIPRGGHPISRESILRFAGRM